MDALEADAPWMSSWGRLWVWGVDLSGGVSLRVSDLPTTGDLVGIASRPAVFLRSVSVFSQVVSLSIRLAWTTTSPARECQRLRARGISVRRGGALVGTVLLGSVVSWASARWRPGVGARGLRRSVIVTLVLARVTSRPWVNWLISVQGATCGAQRGTDGHRGGDQSG
jgi:hypothetical protein